MSWFTVSYRYNPINWGLCGLREKKEVLHAYICKYAHTFIVLPKKGFSTQTGDSQGKKFVKQILRRPVWSKFRLLTVHSWSFSEYLITKIAPSGLKFLKAREQIKGGKHHLALQMWRESQNRPFLNYLLAKQLEFVSNFFFYQTQVSLWVRNRFPKPCKSKPTSYLIQ